MNDLALYHISCNEYSPGFIVPIPDVTLYHQNAIANGLDWIDNYLDSLKPTTAPSRSRTFYAFGNIQHCLIFFNKRQCDTGTKRIYKVRMKDPFPAPMCLTDGLEKNGNWHTKNESITNEYWAPQNDWKVLEYLSETMEIVEDITASTIGMPQMGMQSYWDDQNLRKKLFNC